MSIELRLEPRNESEKDYLAMAVVLLEDHYKIHGEGTASITSDYSRTVIIIPDSESKITEVNHCGSHAEFVRSTPELVAFDIDQIAYLVRYLPKDTPESDSSQETS